MLTHALAALLLAAPCAAQSVVALETGDRAPHAGMLVLDDDLYAQQRDLRLCGAERDQLLARIAATVASQQRIDDARDRAERQRVELHDGLWRQQVVALQAQLAAASEPWRSAWLWGAIGLVVGVAASVAIALAMGGG